MKRKHMKLPNGFGQITKLKGRLRKPYRVMITVGHNEHGKPISKLLKPVSYFETYNDAYSALIKQNENPYDSNKDATLKEVYEDWIEDYSNKISTGRLRCITTVWKKLSKYYDMKLADIKPKLIKEMITECGEAKTTVRDIKIILNKVMDHAIVNDIIDKNYSRMSKINSKISNESTKGHITFGDNEISILWKNKNDMHTRWILIQCYTGMRPSELCSIKLSDINLEENYITGGMKTKAGKNRIIPIHKDIKSLVETQIEYSKYIGSNNLLCENKYSHISYTRYITVFYKIVKTYALNSEHAPHDCRKFFISQAKKYKLDEYAIKRIVGHSITDITESIYTVRDPSWLLEEINKIVV